MSGYKILYILLLYIREITIVDEFMQLCPLNPPGIYGVGKAAEHPPALAVLSHKPEGATQTIAWVGKGIVYDTGGLSIKGKVRLNFTQGLWHSKTMLQKLGCHHCFSFQVARAADACINSSSHQTTMPGMKRDCGGAAAILGAFKATIKQVE